MIRENGVRAGDHIGVFFLASDVRIGSSVIKRQVTHKGGTSGHLMARHGTHGPDLRYFERGTPPDMARALIAVVEDGSIPGEQLRSASRVDGGLRRTFFVITSHRLLTARLRVRGRFPYKAKITGACDRADVTTIKLGNGDPRRGYPVEIVRGDGSR